MLDITCDDEWQATQTGIYIFQCFNRPVDVFKIGVTDNFARRFHELCVHDLPSQCIFRACVRFNTDIGTLTEQDELDIRATAHILEQELLEATRTQQAFGMREEWRLGDVEEVVEQLHELVSARNMHNGCLQMDILEVYRPDTSRYERTVQPAPTFSPISTPRKTPRSTPRATALPLPNDLQRETLNKAMQLYTEQGVRKMQLRWMCGIGKTLYALYWFRELVQTQGFRTCVIGVPSLVLVDQWKSDVRECLRTWYDNDNAVDEALLVVGSSGTTNPNDICTFVATDSTLPRVLLTTYHSAHLLATHLTAEVDLLVMDEAHHLVGADDPETPHVFLRVHNIPTRCTLSMTATPKCCTVGDTVRRRVDVYSMDDTDVFGVILDTRNLTWAIDARYVCDYEVCVMHHTFNDVCQLAQRVCNTGDDTSLTLVYAAYLAAEQLRTGRSKKLLLYTNCTENADRVCEYVRQFLDDDHNNSDDCIVSLHSNRGTAAERNVVEQRFERAARGVICCVYIYAEGVNMPFLDGVVFGEEMHSTVRIVQSALRGCRVRPNEHKKALIVLPVIMPSVDDELRELHTTWTTGHDEEWRGVSPEERALERRLCNRASFRTVRKVLQNLGQYDENVIDRLHCPLRDGTSPTGSSCGTRDTIITDHSGLLHRIVRRLTYHYIQRGSLTRWDVGYFVKRVLHWCNETGERVYNLESYTKMCRNINAYSSELPANPYRIQSLNDFHWSLVDTARAQYYATAREAHHALQAAKRTQFVCEQCAEYAEDDDELSEIEELDVCRAVDSRLPPCAIERYYCKG